jgi:hypothetical protein
MDALCADIVKQGGVARTIVYGQGVRLPEEAHKWSTAYNICLYLGSFAPGKVAGCAFLAGLKGLTKNLHEKRGEELWKNLQGLEGGKDADGTTWLGVDTKGTKWSRQAVIRNAREILSCSGVRGPAAEGYPSGCPRRLPNISKGGLSKHLYGRAIDAKIRWTKDWGEWTQDTSALIRSHALSRPVFPSEPWHFELATAFDFSGAEVELEFDYTSSLFATADDLDTAAEDRSMR